MAVFDRCGDNWIPDGNGGLVALSVPAIESTLRLMRVPIQRRLELLDTVQAIGRTIIEEQRAELARVKKE